MISVWVFLVLSGLAVWVQGTQPFSAPATVRSASSTSTPSAPIYEEHTINLLAQIGKAPDVEQLFVVTEQVSAFSITCIPFLDIFRDPNDIPP